MAGSNFGRLPGRKPLYDPKRSWRAGMDPDTVEPTGKPARWCLKLSEFELDIAYDAVMKHQAAEALSPLMTKVEDGTRLDDEVLVLTLSQELCACEPMTKTPSFESIVKRRSLFLLFDLEVCTMWGITDKEKVETPLFIVLIMMQSPVADCHSTFASAGRPSTCFNFDSSGVLVRAFSWDVALQWLYPPIYDLISFTFATIPSWLVTTVGVTRTSLRVK